MLQHPARSHGRVLFTSARPRGRLNTSQITGSTSNSVLNAASLSPGSGNRRLDCLPRQQWRWFRTRASGPIATLSKVGRKSNSDILDTPNALAKALRDTGVWDGRALKRALKAEEKAKRGSKLGRPKKGAVKDEDTKAKAEKAAETEESSVRKRAAGGDKSRVQVTNEDLVNDMIDYLRPTLERHRGCDLISVYPGAGAWNKALHDAVQPRSHLLFEPDESTYRPFLQPLLDQDNVRLVPKSGIHWGSVSEVLTPQYLPDQVEFDRKDFSTPPPRNDTLLVTINLAMYPKKRFGGFQSVSRMVLFQLVQTIRTSTLYQKYGQVRMLIWIPDDEKRGVLPRLLSGRRRIGIEAELNTEYIAEVCGRDSVAEEQPSKPQKAGTISEGRTHDRWPQMDLESARRCRLRMQELRMVTPPGRETNIMKALDELIADEPEAMEEGISMFEMRDPVAGKNIAVMAEYRALLAKHNKKPFRSTDADYVRLKAIEQYFINRHSGFTHAVKTLKEYDAVVSAYDAAADAKATEQAAELLAQAQELEAAFDTAFAHMAKYRKEMAFTARDAVHALARQPADLGPVLTWDRRPYEPLPATAADFFPNVPCALLDIQPRAPHPLLRSVGPGTENAGEIFDMILGAMTDGMASKVAKQMRILWPGADEGVLPRCGSLTDPARGGIPLQGQWAITNRCLNYEQMMEILEEFMAWPFRPSHAELVGRLANDEYSDDESEIMVKGNAAWQSP